MWDERDYWITLNIKTINSLFEEVYLTICDDVRKCADWMTELITKFEGVSFAKHLAPDTLLKQACLNILKIYHQKWKLSDINSDIFHISAQNIDCGYLLELPWWGNSNEYPQSMFLSRKNVYPSKPQFSYIKVVFKGLKIVQACFGDDTLFFSWNYGYFFFKFLHQKILVLGIGQNFIVDHRFYKTDFDL